MVQVLFFNISHSEIIIVDPSGLESVSNLSANSINISVNYMESIVSVSGKQAQNGSNKTKRSPEEPLYLNISNYLC